MLKGGFFNIYANEINLGADFEVCKIVIGVVCSRIAGVFEFRVYPNYLAFFCWIDLMVPLFEIFSEVKLTLYWEVF